MNKIRSMLVDQSIVGEPERRGDERSEAARSGVSPTIERETSTTPPDPEVTARHARRRFTTQYKLEILRKADACVRPGQLGALLRKEGLYSSHLVTWRRQRADGLTPKGRTKVNAGRSPREARARESSLDDAAAESRGAARVPKKSCRAPADSSETVRERRGRLMMAVNEAIAAIPAEGGHGRS